MFLFTFTKSNDIICVNMKWIYALEVYILLYICIEKQKCLNAYSISPHCMKSSDVAEGLSELGFTGPTDSGGISTSGIFFSVS